MKKLKVGVIGAGRIGRVHAENLVTRMRNVEVLAVSDVKFQAAQSLAKDLGIPQALEDYHPILSNPEIDAVIICSSTDTHARIIEEAAQAKKHIFCEKPVDLSLAKIHQALAAVEKSGVCFQLGFNRRFDPSFRRVAEMVKSGALGAPHLVKITSRDPSPPPAEYVAVSGGIFLDMSIHDFDMARFLAGEEVEEVHAMGAVLIDPAIGQQGDVDTAVVSLRYKSGALCVIDNSRKAVYGYDQRVEVFGSKGTASAENVGPNHVTFIGPEGYRQDPPLHFFIERYADAYISEMKEFVDAALGEGKPSVGGIDGLQSLLIGLAAKKSLKENRPVRLSEVASNG